jgi:hypothetical protein
MIWAALAQSGFTRRSREGIALTPAAEALPKFIGVELGALKLLGLERRAKPVATLSEYLNGRPKPVTVETADDDTQSVEVEKEPDAG